MTAHFESSWFMTATSASPPAACRIGTLQQQARWLREYTFLGITGHGSLPFDWRERALNWTTGRIDSLFKKSKDASANAAFLRHRFESIPSF
jgi:hypothetical protein